MNKIRELIIKYKELIVYGIFGLCTTVVNLLVFKLSNVFLGDEKYLVSNIIAWVVAVVFAYITNKLWVFESKSWQLKVVVKEVSSFFAARVFSFLVEEVGLYIFVDLMHFDEYSFSVYYFGLSGEMISKIILAFAVVVLNYLFSKIFIFKKKKQ